MESLLGEGKYETLVRETTESIFDDVRDVVPDTVERELRLIGDKSAARGLDRVAKEEGAELIVVGSSSRSRMQRVLMGSVAEALLSGSPVPVALAPGEYAGPAKKSWDLIGCGFNESVEARAALDLAGDLAIRLEAALRLIAVHQPPAFAGVSSSAFGFDSVNQSLRQDLQQRLDEAVSNLTEPARAQGSLLDGDPASVLIEQSEKLDMLVLGSRGYGPIRSVVLGSVSRALGRDAACPVLVAPRPS
jgi:nucleotide-binding universal stress UspA family protein